MTKKFKKIIICLCLMFVMCNILPSYADTIDGVDVVETESTAPTETAEETSEENTEETEETTEKEVEQLEDIVNEEIVKSTDATDGEKVENENEDVDTTETTDVVATDSDAEEIDVEEEPEGEVEDIEESTTYAEEPEEEPEEKVVEEPVEMEVKIDEDISKPLLGKEETTTMVASDSEADEEIVEEIEEEEEKEEKEEATPSEALELDLELKAPVKLGAPAPTDIYMYLDTVDNTKLHYTSLSTVPSSMMYNGGTIGDAFSNNNVQSFLSGTGTGISRDDITEVIIDDDLYPTNPRGLFSHYTQITSITNFNKLHLDNATSIEGLFTHCDALTSVDMSGWNLANVTRADYLFAVSGITGVNMSVWSGANSLQSVSCMFMQCNGLTNVDLNAMKTSSITDFSGLFYGCSNIVTADLNSFNTSSATTTQYMFYNCSNLENIYVGSGFVLPGGANTSSMFTGCVKLPGYDPANVDGSMISTYTKPKPVPPPAPPSGGTNGGSSGGGGGGGSMSGPIKQAVVLPTSKTNIWVLNSITGRLNFISEADKTTMITNSWVKSDVQGIDGRYLVDKYGDVLTGFVKLEGNLYYFSEDNTRYGKMLAKEEININGEKYYFDERGVCITPKMPQAYYDVEFYNTEHQGLITHLGYYFNFDDNKNMTIGLKEINGSLYYFSTEPNTKGRLTCGSINIGGAMYFFDPNNGGRGTRIS